MLTDYMAGTLLAFGVTAALRRRDRTGKGQKVSTSLLQAGLALQNYSASVIEAVDSWKHEFVEWIEQDGPSFGEALQRRTAMTASNQWFFNTFETADGAIAIGAPGNLRKRLLEVLGTSDPAVTDPNWVQPDDPREHMAQLTATVRAKIAAWRTDDLVSALEAEALPCSRVRFLEQVLLGEHARANGFVSTFDHPRLGPITMPTVPVRFSGSRYQSAETTPGLGEHTLEVLAELGYSNGDVAALLADKIVVAEE